MRHSHGHGRHNIKQDQPSWRWRSGGAYRTPGASDYLRAFDQRQAEKRENAILALLDRGLPLRYVDSKAFFGKRNMDVDAMKRLITRGVVVPAKHETTRYVRPTVQTAPTPVATLKTDSQKLIAAAARLAA